MNQSVIYALDFDGVLCDSAIETGVSGWRTATKVWDDFSSPLPTRELLEQFRQVRPVMVTGYEAVFLVRLLKDGESVDQILADYPTKKLKLIDHYKLELSELKKLFGETRDQWINDDLADWVGMNPLFPGISEKLKRLTERADWYIVTTKQERFVKQILVANHVKLPDFRIFGLDRNKTKVEILTDLAKKHPQQQICFVEDMLPSLKKVIVSGNLNEVKLMLALWGYNTEQDRVDAKNYPIELVDRDAFLS